VSNVFLDQVFEEVIVDDSGAIEGGMHAPEKESHLQRVIKWNPIGDEMNEGLKSTEHDKDHPIG
jgi:hypothetical protein